MFFCSGSRAQLSDFGQQRLKIGCRGRGFFEFGLEIAIAAGRGIGLELFGREKLIEFFARGPELDGVSYSIGAALNELHARLLERIDALREQCCCLIDVWHRSADQHRAARGAQSVVGAQHDGRRHVVLHPLQNRQQLADRDAVPREIRRKLRFLHLEMRDIRIERGLFRLEIDDPRCGFDELLLQRYGLRLQSVSLLLGVDDRGAIMNDLILQCVELLIG